MCLWLWGNKQCHEVSYKIDSTRIQDGFFPAIFSFEFLSLHSIRYCNSADTFSNNWIKSKPLEKWQISRFIRDVRGSSTEQCTLQIMRGKHESHVLFLTDIPSKIFLSTDLLVWIFTRSQHKVPSFLIKVFFVNLIYCGLLQYIKMSSNSSSSNKENSYVAEITQAMMSHEAYEKT